MGTLSEPRIAIVGAGAIAESHADAYLAGGGHVVAVVSQHAADARRLAARLPGAEGSDDLQAVLERADVDAVDICTPSDRHAAIAVASAQAGKHVHVEKPMALSLVDADAVIDACRLTKVKLMVGQTARFHAVSRALRATVDAGEVGRPFHFEVVWDHGTFWPGGWRGWQIDPVRSGGHLVHNGVHAFDLACWLLGDRPRRVHTQARAVAHPAMGTHDYWHALVTFATGATAACEIGYVLRPTGAVHREARLYGTAGAAFHTSVDDGQLYADGGAQSVGLVGADAMHTQIADWLACLRGEREVPVSGADGRRALAVSLAAQRSVESGSAVDVVE